MKDIDQTDWSLPIWEREKPRRFWDPSQKLLKSIREYQTFRNSKNPINIVRRKLCVIRHRFWSIVTGAEIDLTCQIGGGLMIPHPNGIVIHPSAIIGPNCLIFQQVTLTASVKLGFHVDVGAGAKLLGPIQVKNNARIGANAVVTKDVEEGDTVVGVPAKSIK